MSNPLSARIFCPLSALRTPRKLPTIKATPNSPLKKNLVPLVPLVDKNLRGRSWMFFLAAALLFTGCSSGPKMAPGKSAAEISVKAEPKKGYHPPTDAASYAASSADQPVSPSAPAGPMTLLDYNALYGIVVWLETS